jgi:hypothetical protein
MRQSKKMISTTGKVQQMLIDSIDRACKGQVSASDGKNIIGFSNQLANIINVELKNQAMQAKLGLEVSAFGAMKLGE